MNNNIITLEDLAERILQADTVTVTRTLTYSFDPSVDDKYDIEETPTFQVHSCGYTKLKMASIGN